MKLSPRLIFLLIVVAGVSLGGWFAGLATNAVQVTTLAVFVEIAVSFMFNYFLRKFFIFRG